MIYYKYKTPIPIYYFCEIEYIHKTEEFKDIPGYEGLYQVSDLGRVKSLKRNYMLQINKSGCGYLMVGLYILSVKKSLKVHQLIAMAFLNHRPNGTNVFSVDHIDNIKINNRLINIQVISHRQNMSKDRKNKTSKYTGVSWDKVNNKWVASIGLNKKYIKLGRFKNELDAKKAYDEKLKSIS